MVSNLSYKSFYTCCYTFWNGNNIYFSCSMMIQMKQMMPCQQLMNQMMQIKQMMPYYRLMIQMMQMKQMIPCLRLMIQMKQMMPLHRLMHQKIEIQKMLTLRVILSNWENTIQRASRNSIFLQFLLHTLSMFQNPKFIRYISKNTHFQFFSPIHIRHQIHFNARQQGYGYADYISEKTLSGQIVEKRDWNDDKRHRHQEEVLESSQR